VEQQQLAYRVNEAARLLGVSRSAMYDLLTSGRVGYVRIAGGSRRVPASEIDRFLAENLVRRSGDAA
jgi:excisionase family DNA binding protein